MKQHFKTFLPLFLCLTTFLKSHQEIKSIQEVTNFLSEGKSILVFLDIDNTLLRPKTDLGSDQWIHHLYQEKLDQGMTHEQAHKLVIPLFFHINNIIELIPTESTLIDDIDHLKKSCEHVICLTARSLPIAERTLQQLHKNSLYFHVPGLDEFVMDLMYPNVYKQGCLFCGPNSKGDVMLAFLKAINYNPDVIVFVDDKETHLNAVESAAQQKNIQCVCLRYTGCDEHVRNYDSEKTNHELQEFLIHYPMQ